MSAGLGLGFGFQSSGGGSTTAISGTGTPPKVPKFSAAHTLVDSQISDDGTTVFIGASVTSANAILEINNNSKGILFPRLTTAQRDALVLTVADDSLFIFNTDIKHYQYYNSSTSLWETVDNGLNGIYSGSGTVPTTTVATITDTLSIGSSSFANILRVDGISGGVSLGSNLNNAKLDITGLGSTLATKSLSIKNSSLVEKFYVRDDGMVSSTDGYSIGGRLFIHTEYNGVNDITSNNIFIGYLTPTTANGTVYQGLNNVAIGGYSQIGLTTGYSNVSSGSFSLNKLTVGRDNVAVGINSLLNLGTGVLLSESFNTAIGTESYISLVSGKYNVGLGLESGTNITAGDGNTCLGYLAGASSSGTYNHSIAIGSLSQFNASNQMVVGNQAGGAYINEVIWGGGIEVGSGINPLSFTQKITNIAAGTLDTPTQYDFVFQSSAGTGTGLGGKFIFKVAPAGATGTTQNAFVDAMTILQNADIQANTGDFQTVLNTKGFVVLDRTNGNKYRIYTNGGVVNTELVP